MEFIKTEEVKTKLQVGDTIICYDKDDLIETMQQLARNNVECDWIIAKENDEYKLEVVAIYEGDDLDSILSSSGF